jgi:hypothetical protein
MPVLIFAPMVLIVLAVIAVVVFGLVSLVLNRRFRAVVLTILAIPVLLVFVVFGMFSLRVERTQSEAIREEQAVRQAAVQAHSLAMRVQTAERVRAKVELDTFEEPAKRPIKADTALAKSEPEKPALSPAKKSTTMLRMLANALLKAIDEQDQAEAPVAAPVATKPAPREEPKPVRAAAAADRPEWVDATSGVKDGAYQTTVSVGPYTTRAECDAKLPEELQRALDRYVVASYGRESAGRVRLTDDIQKQLVKTQWEEHREFDLSPTLRVPMVQLHVLLRFDRPIVSRIHELWRQVEILHRVANLAALGVIVLLVLFVLWSYLRLDLSTAGRYRWRLRFAAALLLLTIAMVTFRA